MIVVIDHYDSFIYNIIDIVKKFGYEVHHVYYDQISCVQLEKLSPKKVILSPGPKHPDDVPQTHDIIRFCAKNNIPVLGVCLGHQIIGSVYGAEIYQTYPMHGVADQIIHNGDRLFTNIESQFTAARYHALSVRLPQTSQALQQIATQKNGIVMGIKHSEYPIYGIQFHPESILTKGGDVILFNFLNI